MKDKTYVKKSVLFGNLLVALALGSAGLFGSLVSASASDGDWTLPDPHFTVFPEWEWLDILDWPDVEITATVAGKSECVAQGMSSGGTLYMGFPEGCDVVVGDTVNVTGGGITRTHVVENLEITAIDVAADTVEGTADAGAVVDVWMLETGVTLQATADASGLWQVDFSGVFDIQHGEFGRSEIRDPEGNATSVEWRAPNPHFGVFPEWEFVEGWEWPFGEVVHLTINDPSTPIAVDYEQSETVGNAPFDPATIYVSFYFPDAYDVKPGDVVTLTDGETTRTHTVRNLAITSVDEVDDTVAGTADVGEVVYLWPHGSGAVLTMTVGTSETWLADFSGVSDLAPGDSIRAEIRDEQENMTSVDWFIPWKVYLPLVTRQDVGLWVAAFTYDPPAGTFSPGTHPYHFEFEWTLPEPGTFSGQGGELDVSTQASLYDGYVLLRGPMELRGVDTPEGLACEEVTAINPGQPTRFLVGWLYDEEITYADAKEHFESITASAVWNEVSASLVLHEVIPFSWDDQGSWFQYVCTFTK